MTTTYNLLDRFLNWLESTFGIFGRTMQWAICSLIYFFPIYFLPVSLLIKLLVLAVMMFTGSLANLIHPLLSLVSLYFVLTQPLDTLGIIYLVYCGLLLLDQLITWIPLLRKR